MLSEVVVNARKEELLTASEHGSALLKVFELLSEARDRKETEELAVSIMKGVQGCILQGGRAKLPSTMKSTTWSAFHRFRVSEGIWSKWVSYLKFLNAPEDTVQIREIALQVLLRRALMHEMALIKQPKPAEPCRVILTDMEKNAISYMTGYVIKKLTDKYKASSCENRDLFLLILRRMHSNEITSLGVPVKSYTEWTELVDRGNLITVTPQIKYYNLLTTKDNIHFLYCIHL